MNTNSSKTEWFIQQSDQTLGPYSLDEMIRMKQSNKLYDHDYVWASHLPGWIRAYFVAELKLTGSEPEINKRRHPRYDVELDCYVSSSQYAYQGQVKSLSQGGMLVEAGHPHLQIGQEVTLLSKPSPTHPKGFVKRGRVVNKQFIPHKVQFKSSCQYIVTLNEEDPSVVENLSDSFRSEGGLL
jgi:hypothetical protein